MREIAWLQVSDIHMRLSNEWSQDIVLRAMADSIRKQRNQGLTLDFILATGDLAYSGKEEEYELVKRFFDELVDATGVPKERIFCIPGNHDVNRNRQKLCFKGARAALTSQNTLDPILAPDSDDIATLLQRQEAYQAFQNLYFGSQLRNATPDCLAYTSLLNIEDIEIAIVGLNSAWLAEGGKDDHGNLLIGERQALNAFDIARKSNVHIVIGMAHHPLHLLREFDRNTTTRHITKHCDFYHCGHLHQPEYQGAGFDASACLTVAAGASFETRESQNAYSMIKLNLLTGTRTLTTVQYDPGQGAFKFSNNESFPISLSPVSTCTVGELADAISAFDETLAAYSYYLAALLMGQKTEVPIPCPKGHVLGTPDVLQNSQHNDYHHKVVGFLHFRNVLTVLYGRRSLESLLAQHGQALKDYGMDLLSRCHLDADLAHRLTQQDSDVRSLFSVQPKVSFAAELLSDLAQSGEWELLAESARRHLENRDAATKICARRMLAFALAHTNKDESARLYRALIQDGEAETQDHAYLANVLHELGRSDEAKIVLLEAIAVSTSNELKILSDFGQIIVGQTSDRVFREQLKTAISARNGS